MMIQDEIYTKLMHRFESGKLPASLLLTGPRGVGKWRVAIALAKRIVCLSPNAGKSCDQCSACRQFEQFAHPDVHFLFPLPANEDDWGGWYFPYLSSKQEKPFAVSNADAKHFIPIEAIRQFQAKLARVATLSPFKVGIIYEAERMLPGTMDSLLKLLEEPPDRTFLFVITPEPRFLLPTIISRLQRVNVPALSDEFVTTYLSQTCNLHDEQLTTLTSLLRGQLCDVDAILQGDFAHQRESAVEMFEASLTKPAEEIHLRYGESALLGTREKVDVMLRNWQAIARDLAVIISFGRSLHANDQSHYLLNGELGDRYAALPNYVSDPDRLETISDRLEITRQELRRNVNPRMAALSFLFSLGESADS